MEAELQFVYRGSGPFVVPTRLAWLELARSRSFLLLDTYFDSEALVLRHAGCSLRVREADGAARPWLTFKGPSRRRSGLKRRHEVEVEIDAVPGEDGEVLELPDLLGLAGELREFAGANGELELRAIGTIRSRRSRHRYSHGLHCLELAWDELEFPAGPGQTRLEVEARTEVAERLLSDAADELRRLFGDDIAAPELGTVRELCTRLYPDLVAA